MQKHKLRIGLIGAGGIACGVHLPAWKNINEAEVVAVADINEAAARKAGEQFDIPQVFTDYHELTALGLDAVDICTPNKFHTPAVLSALEAGSHVLCEKPLAVTTAEVRKMGELADCKGRILMTGQHMRYLSHSQAVKKWVDSCALGEVYHARVRAMRRAWIPTSPGFLDPVLSGGGPCMDIGVHALDNCLWVMGFPKPVRVTGTIRRNFGNTHDIPGAWGEWDRDLMQVEDFAAGFVHFDNGATMQFEAAWLGHQEEMEDFSWQLFGKKAGVQWPSLKWSSVQAGQFVQGTITAPRGGLKGHQEEIAAFVDAIREGKPSPVPWTESIHVIAILEAIYESARTGREIILK